MSNSHPKYYTPSSWLVEYLEKELQSLKPRAGMKGDETTFKRTDTKIAKKKHDAMPRLFQAMANLVYFTEMLERHPDLRSYLEDDLKELLGHSYDSTTNKQKRYASSGTLERFLSAILLTTTARGQPIDFRVDFIDTIVSNAVNTMQTWCDTGEEVEKLHMDSKHLNFWISIFKKQYKEKQQPARNALGFSLRS